MCGVGASFQVFHHPTFNVIITDYVVFIHLWQFLARLDFFFFEMTSLLSQFRYHLAIALTTWHKTCFSWSKGFTTWLDFGCDVPEANIPYCSLTSKKQHCSWKLTSEVPPDIDRAALDMILKNTISYWNLKLLETCIIDNVFISKLHLLILEILILNCNISLPFNIYCIHIIIYTNY
jgi:hypothetical protein